MERSGSRLRLLSGTGEASRRKRKYGKYAGDVLQCRTESSLFDINFRFHLQESLRERAVFRVYFSQRRKKGASLANSRSLSRETALSDLNLMFATDSVEEAIAHIRTKAVESFGLKRVAHMRRHFPWLGERGFSGKGPAIC